MDARDRRAGLIQIVATVGSLMFGIVDSVHLLAHGTGDPGWRGGGFDSARLDAILT